MEVYGFKGGKKKIVDMAAMSLKLAARLKLPCKVLLYYKEAFNSSYLDSLMYVLMYIYRICFVFM